MRPSAENTQAVHLLYEPPTAEFDPTTLYVMESIVTYKYGSY